MDWIAIESFLKDTVWGIVILSIVGGGLLLLILNLVGRANKGVKWLWVFYREGNKTMVKRMVMNPYNYESWKLLHLYTQFFVLGQMVVITSNILKSEAVLGKIILSFFIIAFLINIILVNTIFTNLMKANRIKKIEYRKEPKLDKYKPEEEEETPEQ